MEYYRIDKAKRMIEGASKTILFSTWKEEFVLIEGRLRNALKRKARIAVIHFGHSDSRLGQIYQHL